MKTIDDALKYADTFDKPANKHMSIVMLASEVRRLRDEINGLTGSLDRAEKALKEAQEQEPVAWINLNKWTPSNGPQCVTHEEYEKERELLTKLTAVYAAPVPAVAAPAVPEGWREVVNAMVEWWDDQHMTMEQGREIRNKARALLQSTEPRP